MSMSNDLKTTITVIVGGIISLISILWRPLSPEVQNSVTMVIVTVTLMILGYFTNKSSTPKPPTP